MVSFDPIVAVMAGTAATGWAFAGAARLRRGRVDLVMRGLLGGGAAAGIAFAAYDLLLVCDLGVCWDTLLRGGWPALFAAAIIGLVEEAAKLAGLLLAARAPRRQGSIMAVTIGVAAGFAAVETVVSLSGARAPAALLRAALAPVAHAVLSAPLGFAVAHAAQAGRRAALALVPAALAVSASLHAAGDLSLATPRLGSIGYACALLAPVLAVFLHARRPARVPAPAPAEAARRRSP